MSIAEMREKIVAEINKLEDEKALYEILQVLDNKHIRETSIDATINMNYLFKKHDGLLKRLS